jgi:DNA mismatch repair protein MutS
MQEQEADAEEHARDEARQQAWQDLSAALGDIDPDALSPREALEQLYQLKRLAALAPA